MSSPSEGSSGKPQTPQERAAARKTILQLLKQDPKRSELYNMLGALAIDDNQINDAIDAFKKAVEISPNRADYWSNLGESLRRAGRKSEAIEAIQRAVKVTPSAAQAQFNLGVMLLEEKRFEEAVAAFAAAIRCNPKLALAHERFGHAMGALGKWNEAVESCQTAVQLEPHNPQMWLGLGAAHLGQGLRDEAMETFRKGVDACGPNAALLHNLGDLLRSCCQFDEAMELWREAAELDPKDIKIHTNLVYYRLFHDGSTLQMIRDEQAKWVERYARPLMPAKPPAKRDLRPGQKLRIGYASPYFRHHVLGQNLWPLLSNHDRERFEIVCYNDVEKPDALTERFRSLGHLWRDTRQLGDAELAEQIKSDQVDVLVDLSQHMADNRLMAFARMPAPVQISFAGYPASTGLPTIRYRISDPLLDPPEQTKNELEQLLYLRSFWCYYPLEEMPAAPLPAESHGTVTFGCLNAPCKINPSVLQTWAQTMQRVGNSRLHLLSKSEQHRVATAHILGQHGISPDRLTFLGESGHAAYMRQYDEIDIVLDSWPYGGHTTSLDALWMGVPVVTLVGETSVGRAGLSQLTNLQMPELAARSTAEFVEIARRLAGDIERLSEIRGGLRQRMEQSPLMDAVGFTREVEQAFRAAWEQTQ